MGMVSWYMIPDVAREHYRLIKCETVLRRFQDLWVILPPFSVMLIKVLLVVCDFRAGRGNLWPVRASLFYSGKISGLCSQ